MLRWCSYTLPDSFKYSRETWLQLCVGWFQRQAQHTIAMSPSVTPVIFIITATVQEKKENQQTCHRVYGTYTHTSTYYPTNMSSQVRALSTCSLAIPWPTFDGEWYQRYLAQELPCRSNSDGSTAKLSRTPLRADKNDLGLQLREMKPKQQYFVWQEGCLHRGWALCIEGMGWTRPHTHIVRSRRFAS